MSRISLSTYDVWKLLALLTMTIDHAGFFFFPDESWMRVVGRLSMPIWLYLAGSNGRYDKISPLIFWGLAVSAMNLAAGAPFFPLSILISIALARWVCHQLQQGTRLAHHQPEIWALGFLLLLPLYDVIEYGLMTVMIAMLGYRRHQGQTQRHEWLLWLAVFATYYALQVSLHGFTTELAGVFALLLAVLALLLYRAPLRQTIATRLPTCGAMPLTWLTRHTLYYYVGHLALFRLLDKLGV